MAAHLSLAARAIIDELAAGPATREHLIRVAMAVVPPGQAHRKAVAMRKWSTGYRRAAGVPAVPSQSRGDADTVTVGARSIARDALWSMIRTGRVVRDGDVFRLGSDR
jgi:hypothetical protein